MSGMTNMSMDIERSGASEIAMYTGNVNVEWFQPFVALHTAK